MTMRATMGLVHVISLVMVAKNGATLEKRLTLNKKAKATSPSFRLSHKRALQYGSNPDYECSSDAIIEWIDEELQAPDEYYQDIDSLNPNIGTTGSFPISHECYEQQDKMCEVLVVTSGAYAPAPYTMEAPCTRCDFVYEGDDENCFNADCKLYQCLQKSDQSNSGNQGASVAPENASQSVLIAPYQNLYHDGFTAISCPGLPSGEVDCQSCLEAGCAAVKGQCVVNCLVVPDTVCWSNELFTRNTSAEVCNVKAEREANVDICGSSSISNCATCTSTLKSDGIKTCEWYDSEDGHSYCGPGGCNFNGTCGKKTCDVESRQWDELGEGDPVCDGEECVQVCFKSYRYDDFSYEEDRYWDRVECTMKTELKTWTTEFYRGSTNIRKIEFRNGGWSSSSEDVNQDGESSAYCEVIVDGVACNSCSFCTDYEAGSLDIDCSNIVAGAVITCQEVYYGFVHKLLILEEGFTHAPTEAPTTEAILASTEAPWRPTEAPWAPPRYTYTGGSSGGTGLPLGAIVTLVLLGLGILIFFIRNFCPTIKK